MIRRLFKTGNSIVLSLPKEVLDNLGVGDGENVNIELENDQHRLIITPIARSVSLDGVDEDFAHQVSEFIRQYRPALDELAK